MFPFIKRYKELLVIGVLVVLPLGAFLTYSRTGRSLNPMDKLVLFISRPIQSGVTHTTSFFAYHWDTLFARAAIHAENRKLREQMAELEVRARQADELRAENERLRQVLEYVPTASAPTMLARVIGTGPTLNLLTLKIDKGSRDGILKGMPVVSGGGVVGRIYSTSAKTSDVLVYTDPNFTLPVRSERSRARAKVVGQGALAAPMLSQASRTDDFVEGDSLITTGTDGIFPAGLAVGRLTGHLRPAAGMFQGGRVTPTVDLNRLEEVLVLLIPQTLASPIENGTSP